MRKATPETPGGTGTRHPARPCQAGHRRPSARLRAPTAPVHPCHRFSQNPSAPALPSRGLNWFPTDGSASGSTSRSQPRDLQQHRDCLSANAASPGPCHPYFSDRPAGTAHLGPGRVVRLCSRLFSRRLFRSRAVTCLFEVWVGALDAAPGPAAPARAVAAPTVTPPPCRAAQPSPRGGGCTFRGEGHVLRGIGLTHCYAIFNLL